jgi:hypothetical protein
MRRGALQIASSNGMSAPPPTLQPIIAKLNAAVLARSLIPPRIGSSRGGNELSPSDQLTPTGSPPLKKAQIEKWWPITKAAHIKENNRHHCFVSYEIASCRAAVTSIAASVGKCGPKTLQLSAG